MARQRVKLGLLILVAVAAGVGVIPTTVAPAGASDPSSSTLRVRRDVGQRSTSWTGTVDPGLDNADNACTDADAFQDEHTATLTVPDLAVTKSYELTAEIEWADDSQDLILSVYYDNTLVASSDGGEPVERVTIEAAPPGEYTIVACPFASTAPTDYTGRLIARTFVEQLTAPADDRGLAFSATIPADIQRDEGEPLIEIDPQGRIYTCGPTGFSQAQDYAQVSTDGGDQFHLLGQPPRGQFSLGGGGDCALATAPEENAEGNHQLSYVGLSGLLEFATSTSADGGKTMESNAVSGVGSAVDRQWTVATSTDRVHLNFNRAAPDRQIEVCTSNDAGLSYPACQVVSPAPLFPGPMRAMPGSLNTVNPGQPIVYYPWTQGTTVKLAVSFDDGATWDNCQAATTRGEPGNLFPVADHDEDGNLYIAYGDDADFNIYMTTLALADLDGCDGGTTDQADFRVNPGFTEPVVVNRLPLRTVAFPWLVASGEPGRVAVAFYGTETPGRGDSTFAKSWHVYVNQSLNALAANPDFSQVQATTHPIHYDQICLFGIACTAGGDRSLVDFFAIDYNATNGEYVVVYNNAHKVPDGGVGTVSSPMVFRQIAGPSAGGGTVDRNGRRVVRTSSEDPTGDALANFSALATPPETTNQPAADITDVTVGPAVDPETGAPSDDGGFTVTMKVDDLSDAALAGASAEAQAPALLFLFRFVDGYRYAGVQATWDALSGSFSFGHSDYQGAPSECGSPSTGVVDDQCLYFKGETPIQGAVDQEKGTITLTAPLELLQALQGGTGPGERPDEVKASKGDRIYDAAAFTVASTVPANDQVQSFLYQLDNAPAMDFLIPSAAAAGSGGGDDDGGVGDEGGGTDALPATGAQSLLTLLGLVVLAMGGWFALRRRST